MVKKTPEPHEIILDHLRALRQGQTKIQDHLREHDKRFSMIEKQLAAVRGDVAIIHELIVDHSDDIRTLKARIDRLERHAGLTEALKQ
jgi:septal ring factor EnvC (AmiA/AmiB activator)